MRSERKSNGWMVYSIILTALIALALILPHFLMAPGRDESIDACERLLKLAGNRDFDSMASFASPQVMEFMRERDKKWGKVLSYAFEDSVVQVGGTPAEVRFQVWRERKNVREQFHCNRGKIMYASIAWPPAEAK